MGKDYYKLLGVTKDAKEADVKKAYKKAAMKWHPDKNPDKKEEAEMMFKDIAEAYDVLSDSQKRAVYDQFGEEGLKGNGGGGGGFGGMPGGMRYEFRGDPNEIFANLFKGMRGGGFDDDDNPFAGFGGFGGMPGGMGGMFGGMPGGMGGMGGGMGPMGGMMGAKRPCVTDVNLSLEELFHGTTKKMRITRKTVSQGRPEKFDAEIAVKPGWKSGTKITFKGEGDEYQPGQAQDVVFVIKEKPHGWLKRSGNDLVYKARVPLVDALTGFKVDVETLDNRTLRVNVKDMVHPSYTKIVHNEGMPKAKSPGERGDLIITFDVYYPNALTDEQKRAIREAFPKP